MQGFWTVHGIWFVIFMFFFPRLTLLFSSVATGGIFWWLGFIFTPRILVAILATKFYGHTDTILVVLTWLWAFYGENFEKKRIGFQKQRFYPKKPEIERDVIDV